MYTTNHLITECLISLKKVNSILCIKDTSKSKISAQISCSVLTVQKKYILKKINYLLKKHKKLLAELLCLDKAETQLT